MKILAALTALGLVITPAATDPTEERLALDVLTEIAISEDHPMDDYDRDAFAPSGWVDATGSGCTTREDILARDLDNTHIEGCTVEYGQTIGAYSGEPIEHVQGSSEVDIEHVVAVGQAWRNGAHSWDEESKRLFYQDPENLIAVSSTENRSKGDRDATEYMPPNQGAYCAFTAATVYIKDKYSLSMNPEEHAFITDVLEDPECETTPAAPAQAIYTSDWDASPEQNNTRDTERSLSEIVDDTSPLILIGLILASALLITTLALSPSARRMLTRTIKNSTQRKARSAVRGTLNN
ncbi:GmrSD restriction endonuclease domain-containing protein [Micrococcaceae sp. AOP34-BR2-30]